MKTFLSWSLFLSLLMVAHIASAQTWTSQIEFPVPSIKAIDEHTVWAGGINGVFLRTIDGGANWTSGTAPEAGSHIFWSVAAIDENTAYYTGALYSPTEFDTRIYKATDGGANWELQYQSTDPAIINSIAFWDEMHGIAVSDAVNGSFVILTTEDGGANWKQTPAENIPPPLPDEWAGFADTGGTGLALAGTHHAWFGTANGTGAHDPLRIFRSADGGQTWTATDTQLANDGPVHGVSSIVFKDTLNGFASSAGYGSAGLGNTLARTTDGGQTWTNVSGYSWSQSQTNTIVFVPQTEFQVLMATTEGGPYYSNDGGVTWMLLSSDRFLGLSFASPTAGWASGPNGIFKYNGDALKPIDTAVEHLSEIPQAVSLSPNFPNPFKTTTRIQFTLDRRVPVRLSVFDMLGIELAVPVNEELGPGTHETVFDASGLPSGVYFYRIQAGEFLQSRKLTIVR